MTESPLPPLLTRVFAVVATLVLCAGCSSGSPAGATDSPTSSRATSSVAEAGLVLVSVGDSIPYNSPEDCPGCTGFVDQYAKAVEKATGRSVTVQNLSEHTGLTLPQLVGNLDSLRRPLASADVIVVGIAHNSFELNADSPCGRPLIDDAPDWSAVDATCASESAAKHEPMFTKLYSTIAGWRRGKPTILRTLNRYNDWIPVNGADLTKEQAARTTTMHDAWNTMLCSTATASGFACADIYHAFNGPDGTKPSGDLLADDYTHPSQRGNDVIARTLESQGFAALGP